MKIQKMKNSGGKQKKKYIYICIYINCNARVRVFGHLFTTLSFKLHTKHSSGNHSSETDNVKKWPVLVWKWEQCD